MLQQGCVASEVVSRLRVIHVGDGDQAHFLALLGLFEGAQCGLLFLDVSFQQIDRAQHIEIGGCHAHDEVLLLRCEINRRRFVGGASALESIPLSEIHKTLIEIESPAVVINARAEAVGRLNLKLAGERIDRADFVCGSTG